jgi:hypothetical protein
MAMDANRVVNAAHDAYWPACLLRLQAQNIPQAHIDALKAENKQLINCILTAMVNEIKQNAETNVTANLDATLSALHVGSPIPNDGGAAIKSAMNAALPTSTTKRIS